MEQWCRVSGEPKRANDVALLLASLLCFGQGTILFEQTTRRSARMKIDRYQPHDHVDNIVDALVKDGVVVVENLL